MSASRPIVGMLVGGGPAPGINSVISAVTIRSIIGGSEVLGFLDGFKWLMEGSTAHVHPLSIEEVSRIHFRGGSHLGTSRANPTKKPEHLDRVLSTLTSLGVTRLVTIGGDDTAFSALKLEARSQGRLQVVHVPKTIDNDLDLPHGIPTFGFQTARHLGVEILKNLMVDARTTSRWYLTVTMGRKAGHLALGIGKAAGATLTIIPEEFAERPVKLQRVVDLLIGAVIKRLDGGRTDGVVILAEGLVEILDQRELGGLEHVERDEHGHIRLAEIDFGRIIKTAVTARLKELGLKVTVVSKDIGYELRCTDPIPFDMEYTRDLGYCAAKYLIEGGSGAMVTVQEGKFKPIRFEDMLDPDTGRTRVRMVDTGTEYYKIARRYMLRLRRDDFSDPAEVARYATITRLKPEEFRKQFEYLVSAEAPPLEFGH